MYCEADVLQLFLVFVKFKTEKSFTELHEGVFISETSKGFLTVEAVKHWYELEQIWTYLLIDWTNGNPSWDKLDSPLAEDGLKWFSMPWVFCSSLSCWDGQQPELHCIPRNGETTLPGGPSPTTFVSVHFQPTDFSLVVRSRLRLSSVGE